MENSNNFSPSPVLIVNPDRSFEFYAFKLPEDDVTICIPILDHPNNRTIGNYHFKNRLAKVEYCKFSERKCTILFGCSSENKYNNTLNPYEIFIPKNKRNNIDLHIYGPMVFIKPEMEPFTLNEVDDILNLNVMSKTYRIKKICNII